MIDWRDWEASSPPRHRYFVDPGLAPADPGPGWVELGDEDGDPHDGPDAVLLVDAPLGRLEVQG